MSWCSAAVLMTMLTMVGCSSDNDATHAMPQDGGLSGDASSGLDASVERLAEGGSAEDVATDGGAVRDVVPDRSTIDGFIDIFDAFPIPDGPVGGCITCARDKCGMQVNQCANSEPCRTGLACALVSCVPMGNDAGLDSNCVTGCFMGNVGALITAGGALGCISTNCGAACAGGGFGD